MTRSTRFVRWIRDAQTTVYECRQVGFHLSAFNVRTESTYADPNAKTVPDDRFSFDSRSDHGRIRATNDRFGIRERPGSIGNFWKATERSLSYHLSLCTAWIESILRRNCNDKICSVIVPDRKCNAIATQTFVHCNVINTFPCEIACIERVDC